MIKEFKNEYFFLSNMYPCKILYKGLVYKSAESAFQAQKVLEPEMQEQFTELSGPEARKFGKYHVTLRSDWPQVKEEIMLDIVRTKFEQHPALMEKLLDTKQELLYEGNTWKDKYWGVDLRTLEGENKLGNILMQVRQEAKIKWKERNKCLSAYQLLCS